MYHKKIRPKKHKKSKKIKIQAKPPTSEPNDTAIDFFFAMGEDDENMSEEEKKEKRTTYCVMNVTQVFAILATAKEMLRRGEKEIAEQLLQQAKFPASMSSAFCGADFMNDLVHRIDEMRFEKPDDVDRLIMDSLKIEIEEVDEEDEEK